LTIKFLEKELSYVLKDISIDEYREIEKSYDDAGKLKDLIPKEIKLKIEGTLAESSVEIKKAGSVIITGSGEINITGNVTAGSVK
jgi:hypothetical protein